MYITKITMHKYKIITFCEENCNIMWHVHIDLGKLHLLVPMNLLISNYIERISSVFDASVQMVCHRIHVKWLVHVSFKS